MAARTRCGLVEFRECSDWLYGRIFPLTLKVAVYESYVGPAILHGSEAWCLNESVMGIFTMDRRIHGESYVWSTAQIDLQF